MNTHCIKTMIDNYVFDALDNLDNLLTSKKMSPEKTIDILKDMHDEIRNLGYTPVGFQETYEDVYMSAYFMIHPEDKKDAEDEEKEDGEREDDIILYDSKDGYICPFFTDCILEDEEFLAEVDKIFFLPDKDVKMIIYKDGRKEYTE